MRDSLAIPSDKILTSSNQAERDNVRSDGQPWSSALDDMAPSIQVRLSETSDVQISKVKPDNLDNVADFSITITTVSGKVAYQNVSWCHYLVLFCVQGIFFSFLLMILSKPLGCRNAVIHCTVIDLVFFQTKTLPAGRTVRFQSGSLLGSVIKVDFTKKDSDRPVKAELVITACTEHFEGSTEMSTQTTQVLSKVPCPLVDLMTDPVGISSSSVQTSSNSKDKDKLFGGNSPWTSDSDDPEPSLEVTLSESKSVTITEVKLLTPENVKSFVVTIQDASGSTVTKTVRAFPSCTVSI